MGERVKRRLFLFLDGTWNEDQQSSTNIVRLRECLKLGVDDALDKGDSEDKVTGSIIRHPDGSLCEYLAYYDRGVGTGVFLDRWTGGIFGTGLDLNIRQAYRFLSEHYSDGDEIFIFGFSRGAFTARSIVGYVTASGLLKPQFCDAVREERAWKHYRTAPADRFCGEWNALQEFMFDHDTLGVKCLGVFDTVGALGVPLDWFRRLNAEKYAFHDTNLNTIVEIGLHAVAIDERRRSFPAALWQKPKFKRIPKTMMVEQVWFPGAHSDVGGGYEDWNSEGANRCGRQDIAFEWMIGRLRCLVPDLPLQDFEPNGRLPLRIDRGVARKGTIHRPWARLDPIRDAAVRMINQIPVTPGRHERIVGQIAHEEPIYEAVHVSALELLAAPTVSFEGIAARRYRPPNLIAALPAIVQTYGRPNPGTWSDRWNAWKGKARSRPDGEPTEPELRVVDWDGVIIDPRKAEDEGRRAALLALIPEPGTLA